MWQPWPYDRTQTCDRAINPPDDEFIDFLVNRGVADARCWAEDVGLTRNGVLVCPTAADLGRGVIAAYQRPAGMVLKPSCCALSFSRPTSPHSSGPLSAAQTSAVWSSGLTSAAAAGSSKHVGPMSIAGDGTAASTHVTVPATSATAAAQQPGGGVNASIYASTVLVDKPTPFANAAAVDDSSRLSSSGSSDSTWSWDTVAQGGTSGSSSSMQAAESVGVWNASIHGSPISCHNFIPDYFGISSSAGGQQAEQSRGLQPDAGGYQGVLLPMGDVDSSLGGSPTGGSVSEFDLMASELGISCSIAYSGDVSQSQKAHASSSMAQSALMSRACSDGQLTGYDPDGADTMVEDATGDRTNSGAVGGKGGIRPAVSATPGLSPSGSFNEWTGGGIRHCESMNLLPNDV